MRIFALLLVLLACPAWAEDGELQMDVAGTIVIGKDGGVHDYKIATVLTPEIGQVIEHSVRRWRFEPVLRDNKPVLARSQMFLTLTAVPVEKGYRLRIDNVLFGGGRAPRHMSHPDYPLDAMRAGISAYVLVALQIDGNGKVLDVMATQSEIFGTRRPGKQKRQFERASEDAVKRWRFEPADLAAGEPEETTLIVPITYSAGDRLRVLDGWRPSSTESTRSIPWLPADQQHYDARGLKEGQSLALGTGIELVTKVEGSTL